MLLLLACADPSHGLTELRAAALVEAFGAELDVPACTGTVEVAADPDCTVTDAEAEALAALLVVQGHPLAPSTGCEQISAPTPPGCDHRIVDVASGDAVSIYWAGCPHDSGDGTVDIVIGRLGCDDALGSCTATRTLSGWSVDSCSMGSVD